VAFAALEAVVAGHAIEPFFYGRWDAAAQAHQAAQDGHRNEEAAAVFGAAGAFEPDATRAALAEFAELFPNAELVVQLDASHYPWLDDPDRFVGDDRDVPGTKVSASPRIGSAASE
jgi:proline iminopeptidase